MGAHPRAKEIQDLLSQISEAVGAQRFADARQIAAKLSEWQGENDPDVVRTLTLIDFMEGKD